MNGEWDSVGPLISATKDTSKDTRCDKLTDDPAEIDVCAEVGTESNRADFRGVGSGKSLEHTPWDTAEDF